MFGIPTLEGDGTDELDALGFGTSSKRASESEVQEWSPFLSQDVDL